MYDRAVVDQALRLSHHGLSDRTVARICGVSVGTVRHWRYGTRRTDASEKGRRKHDCPRCDGRALDGRLYAYLLGLYLGDGSLVRMHKDIFRLEIACCDDWPGLIDECHQAITAVMPGHSVTHRKRTGCTTLQADSKHWPCLFPQHGPGAKHTRKIELALWQQEIVTEFTKDFIRGLIHSDGCRSMNTVRRPLKAGDRWYTYPRYTFVNESGDIRGIFTDALDLLGIAWRRSNQKTISVARRGAVARLDEFVGPKY